MQQKRLFGLFGGMVFGYALFMCGGPSRAAEFSAELIATTPGETVSMMLYVKDSLYRLEQLEGDSRVLAVVNRRTGITTALNPEEKQYKNFSGMESAFLDPIKAWETLASQLEGKPAGTETIGDYECEKHRYYYPDDTTALMESWVSAKLGHFIKQIVNTGAGHNVLELQNIQERPLADSLFKIPEDYTEFVEPPLETPPPPPSLTTLEVGSAPTGRRISTGGTLKIAINPAADVTVKMRNDTPDGSSWSLIPCKSGTKLTDRAKEYSLTKRWAEEQAGFNCFPDPEKMPDTIMIEVAAGLISVVVEQSQHVGMGVVRDYYIKGPTIHGLGLLPMTPLAITITGDSQDTPESTGKFSVDRPGAENPDEEISFTVKNGETKSWSFTKEESMGQLKIERGAIKVHVEQPPVR